MENNLLKFGRKIEAMVKHLHDNQLIRANGELWLSKKHTVALFYIFEKTN